MARHFKVSYFSNLLMQFPHNILTFATIARFFNGCDPKPDFNNTYGETNGWRAPNQGAHAWGRWFPENYGYVGLGEIGANAERELRSTVSQLQRLFDAPFLNKWQVNSARILPLASIFPEALFIRMRRDPVLIAQSILIGKRKLFSDQSDWFSVRPSTYEELRKKEGIEQICYQVHDLEKDMDRDSEAVGKDRFLELTYAGFCQSVGDTMEKISRFYFERSPGRHLEVRHSVPQRFNESEGFRIGMDEINMIRDAFEKLGRQGSR